jgi:two-component system chemotaxis response regulator CheB
MDPRHRAIAMAASAGGLHALTVVLASLPADLPAAVLVVQHLDPRHRSLMASLLGRRCRLPVEEAVDGGRVLPGVVLVAPPDHHLLVNADRSVSLTQTELVHFVRPSADLLFESVAATYRDRAIAVVLSGMGLDGALGVTAIKKTGGLVIAQDAQAEFRGMPDAAVATGSVDLVLPLDRIAETLVDLCVAAER